MAGRSLRRRALCLSLALDLSYESQEEAPVAAVRLAHRIPHASSLRQLVRHRPGFVEAPLSAVLMGSQARLDALGFADAVGTLRYTSTPMTASPHVDLLRRAMASERPLTDEEIRASTYFAFGKVIATRWHDFFGAQTDTELVEVSRNFVEWALDGAPRVTGGGGSPEADEVLVARIAGTKAYMVMDGHHRVAAAIARGATRLKVRRTWLSAESPLRRRLLARGDALRRPVLTQPLLARDLDRPAVATNCEDRLVRMLRLVDATLDHDGGPRRFLDLGCGSGWYVDAFRRRGYAASGVTDDALDAELAELFHGLSADEVLVGDPVDVAARRASPADVVACLALGTLAREAATSGDAAALAKDAERLGAKVLFCDDTDEDGQGDTPVTRLVLGATGFSRVVDLGPSDDPVPPGGGAVAPRRLLAFVR